MWAVSSDTVSLQFENTLSTENTVSTLKRIEDTVSTVSGFTENRK
jgi:hypothetical protein